MKKYLIAILFLPFWSCQFGEEAIISTDLIALKEKITLDFTPLSVKWSERKTEEYSDRGIPSHDENPITSNLRIILTLTEADWNNLQQQYQKVESQELPVSKDAFDDAWITPEVKESLRYEDNFPIIPKMYDAKAFKTKEFGSGYFFFATGNQVYILMQNYR